MCHLWVFGSWLRRSGLCVSEPGRSAADELVRGDHLCGRAQGEQWRRESSRPWGEVERRGLSGQSRTLGRAACCREGIYCCGRLVCSRLLAEYWVAEEGWTQWQKELVLCVDGVWQTAVTVGFFLAEISGCLIGFLKGSHFIFYINRGRVCSGEDIQLSFLAESTGDEAQRAPCHCGSGSWGTGSPFPRVSRLSCFQ